MTVAVTQQPRNDLTLRSGRKLAPGFSRVRHMPPGNPNRRSLPPATRHQPLRQSPLKLRKTFSPEFIRDNLSVEGGVAFVVHATDRDSLQLGFESNLAQLASIDEQLWRFGPFVGSPIYFRDRIVGANILCPVPVDLWLGDRAALRRFRQTQYFPALELAKQCGLQVAALGALTAYAANYGRLSKPSELPGVTTGHASTAAVLLEMTHDICPKTGLDFDKAKIAVFGAAGRLGGVVSRLLAKSPPGELLLCDLPERMTRLAEIKQDLESQLGTKVSIHGYRDADGLPDFDGALLVTSAVGPYLTADVLRRARFWIDDSHPRAASLEAEHITRNQTLYLECYTRGPVGLDTGFPFPLPTSRDCYACFAEGWAAWRDGRTTDFVTGVPAVATVEHVHNLLHRDGFRPGPLSGKDGTPLV